MYQRIAREHQLQSPTRQAPHPDHFVANAIGKATLAQQQSPIRHLGPAELRGQAIDTTRRELMSIRTVLLPALIKALRSKEPAHIKQRDAANAAMQLRHMLTSANERLVPLEKAATHADPMLLFLRREVDTLVARCSRLGAYKGREHLVPQAYEEPSKQPQPTRRAPTTEKYAKALSRALHAVNVERPATATAAPTKRSSRLGCATPAPTIGRAPAHAAGRRK